MSSRSAKGILTNQSENINRIHKQLTYYNGWTTMPMGRIVAKILECPWSLKEPCARLFPVVPRCLFQWEPLIEAKLHKVKSSDKLNYRIWSTYVMKRYCRFPVFICYNQKLLWSITSSNGEYIVRKSEHDALPRIHIIWSAESKAPSLINKPHHFVLD